MVPESIWHLLIVGAVWVGAWVTLAKLPLPITVCHQLGTAHMRLWNWPFLQLWFWWLYYTNTIMPNPTYVRLVRTWFTMQFIVHGEWRALKTCHEAQLDVDPTHDTYRFWYTRTRAARQVDVAVYSRVLHPMGEVARVVDMGDLNFANHLPIQTIGEVMAPSGFTYLRHELVHEDVDLISTDDSEPASELEFEYESDPESDSEVDDEGYIPIIRRQSSHPMTLRPRPVPVYTNS